MADIMSAEKRSYVMSRVGSKNTQPELAVRKYLHAEGFRFRIHYKDLPGKPDIVLPKFKAVIFVHGCFWHGHEGCRRSQLPATRTDWWASKIVRNQERDKEQQAELREAGWRIMIVWECRLKTALIKSSLAGLAEEIRLYN
jgi:DNA mismatch endonuclease (patch repair protein)